MRGLFAAACLVMMQGVIPSLAAAQPAPASPDAASWLEPVQVGNDDAVRARVRAARLAPCTVRAWLVIGADGRVASAQLERGTGDRHVDAALVDWLEEAGFPESRPRTGWLEVSIDAQGVPAVVRPPAPADLPQVVHAPGLFRVQRAMNLSNLDALSLTLEIDWNAEGQVTSARVLDQTPAPAVEKALATWARKIRFAPGSPGRGRMPVQLKSESWR